MYNRAGRIYEEEKQPERPKTALDICDMRLGDGYVDVI